MPFDPPRRFPTTPSTAPLNGWTFGSHARCCTAATPATPDAVVGSRRRRLWELSAQAHCPVVPPPTS